MLRLRSRFAGRVAIVAMSALALTACGTKGPLVPAKKAPETTAPAAPPPAATSTPQIPSATLPSTTQPAP